MVLWGILSLALLLCETCLHLYTIDLTLLDTLIQRSCATTGMKSECNVVLLILLDIWLPAAQVSRKLTFLYLANDVIQNSKKKGPEFTQDFAPIIVEAFKHVYRWVPFDTVYIDLFTVKVTNMDLYKWKYDIIYQGWSVQNLFKMVMFLFCAVRERTALKNNWAGFCPSGRKEPCTRTTFWISSHKFCVRSHICTGSQL